MVSVFVIQKKYYNRVKPSNKIVGARAAIFCSPTAAARAPNQSPTNPWHGERAASQFVVFDQNHDQVGNRAFGDRMPAPARALAAFCTLLAPFVPMLFMGEEYGEDAPFQFFTDQIDADIAQATSEGRRREFATFASFGQGAPAPRDGAPFERPRLRRRAHEPTASLYRELLRVRRTLSGEAEVRF